MLLHVMNEAPDRDCGECTACCDVVGVEELGKPYYARCKHLGANCGIYSTRPETCRKYRCAWHRGLLGDSVDRRPDRCGVLIDLDQSANGMLSVSVFETIPGAIAQGRHRFLVQKLRSLKKLHNIPFNDPPVNLYPFGSKIHVTFPISSEYEWSPPSGEQIRFEVGANTDEGNFAGEIAELLMPKTSHDIAAERNIPRRT